MNLQFTLPVRPEVPLQGGWASEIGGGAQTSGRGSEYLVRMPPGCLPWDVFWACPSGRRTGADQGHAGEIISLLAGLGMSWCGDERLDLPAQTFAPMTWISGRN